MVWGGWLNYIPWQSSALVPQGLDAGGDLHRTKTTVKRDNEKGDDDGKVGIKVVHEPTKSSITLRLTWSSSTLFCYLYLASSVHGLSLSFLFSRRFSLFCTKRKRQIRLLKKKFSKWLWIFEEFSTIISLCVELIQK